jgi:hypothetical protein
LDADPLKREPGFGLDQALGDRLFALEDLMFPVDHREQVGVPGDTF